MGNRLPRWSHAAACALLACAADDVLAATTIVVERLADGAVRVDYRLDAESLEIKFAPTGPAFGREPPRPRAEWFVLDDGLTLTDDRIASPTGSPFSSASVRIEPQIGPGQGRATVSKIGTGASVIDLALALPAAPAAPISLELRNVFDVRARACVNERKIDDARSRLGSALAWLVVVGTSREACQAASHESGGVFVLADAAPLQWRMAASLELASAYRRLAERLGRQLDPPPTLVVAYEPSGSNTIGWRTGIDSVIAVSLTGDTWNKGPHVQARDWASLTEALARAWFEELVVPSSPQSPRYRHWFVGAPPQYLAALDRHGLGEQPFGISAGRMLVGDIDLCSSSVEAPLRDAPAMAVPVERNPQTCGLLIQFVYDALTRAETGGQRTIFDVWAELLEEADGGPIYPESFLATNERARAAVTGLIDGPVADFERIVATLRGAGVDAYLGDPRDTGGAVASLLRVLAGDDCTEGLKGAGPLGGDRVPIETRGTCQTLPQKVSLIAIEGVGILTSARAVYEATAGACAERGRVRLTGALANEEFDLTCPPNVPTLPRHLYLRDVHFLN